MTTKTITVVLTASFEEGQNEYPDGSNILDSIREAEAVIAPVGTVHIELGTGDVVSGDLISITVS